MGTEPQQSPEPAGALAQAMARAQSLEDVAGLLRALRRRHARAQRDSALTYRELAQRTGWSQAAIAEYFTARTLPPTDRFDALLEVLGAAPDELRALADARDRAEENQRQAKTRRAAAHRPRLGHKSGAAAAVARGHRLVHRSRAGARTPARPGRARRGRGGHGRGGDQCD